jgi:hypothetical protein
MTSLVLTALLLAGQTIALQPTLQPPPAPPFADGTSILRGHLLRSDGRPLPRAQVRLSPVELNGFQRIATTDDEGAFEFKRIPAGGYRLAANKSGYVSLEFGQRRPLQRGEIISLGAGETRERVDFALPRHGAITGRIVDENGDPVERVAVRAMQNRYVDGRRQLVGVAGARSQPTNEQGRYRLYGLQPGSYVVAADVGQIGTQDLPGYATSYYPGTPNPSEAQSVPVGVSQDVASIDFSLVPVRTARIGGKTINASGEPFQGGIQMWPSRRSGAVATDAVGARTEPDGTFEFPNVSPGEYVVHAFRGSDEFAWQFVTVNGSDVTGLIMQTSKGSTITGRLTFEGGSAPNRSEIEISPIPVDPDLAPASGGTRHADIGEDWTFEIANVGGGPRRIQLTRSPAGWTLKAVRVNGSDVTDTPLALGAKSQLLPDVEVVLTNQLTNVAGSVLDGRGQPVVDCTVIVFASDRQLWYDGSRFFSAARPSRDGAFTVRALPAGEYFVAALDRIPGTDAGTEWQDPDFLEANSRGATRVTLTEGQHAALTLKLVRAER